VTPGTTGGGLLGFLRGAGRGYATLARAAAGILAFLAVVAVSSAAIAVPAWLIASHRPGLYTVAALSLFGAGACLLVARRIRRESRAAGGARAWARSRVLPAAARAGFAVLALLAIYGIAVLAAAGLYGAAVPIGLALLLLVGRRAYATSRRRRDHPISR
jgi:hypothetical protein